MDKLRGDVEFSSVIQSVIVVDLGARGGLWATPENSTHTPRVFQVFSTGCKQAEEGVKRPIFGRLDPPRR